MSIVLGLPLLVVAKLPLPNDVLGRMEAVLDTCAQVNPTMAAKYQEGKKTLVQGASSQEVAQARATKEYKEAYDQAKAQLDKEPKEQTAKTCAASMEGGN